MLILNFLMLYLLLRLMSVVGLFESFDDLVVFGCAFGCTQRGLGVLQVNQVVRSHDCLQAVSNHDDGH